MRELLNWWRGRHAADAEVIEAGLARRSMDEVALAIFNRRFGKEEKWNWHKQMTEEEWNAWLGEMAADLKLQATPRKSK